MLVNRSFSLWVRSPRRVSYPEENSAVAGQLHPPRFLNNARPWFPILRLLFFLLLVIFLLNFLFNFPHQIAGCHSQSLAEAKKGLQGRLALPRSMALRWVLPIPAKLLTTSWEIPFFSRTWRIAAPTVSAFNIVYPLLSVSFIVSENKLRFEYIYTQRIQMWQKLGFREYFQKLNLNRCHYKTHAPT